MTTNSSSTFQGGSGLYAAAANRCGACGASRPPSVCAACRERLCATCYGRHEALSGHAPTRLTPARLLTPMELAEARRLIEQWRASRWDGLDASETLMLATYAPGLLAEVDALREQVTQGRRP